MDWFKCKTSYKDKIRRLTDEQAGQLFRALMEYCDVGTAPDLDAITGMAFDFIAPDIDKSRDEYDQRCEVARENGQKGGRKKTNTGSSETEKTDFGFAETEKTDVGFSEPSWFLENRHEPNIRNKEDKNIRIKEKKDVLTYIQRKEFDNFWNLYPRKKSKADAEKAWKKLNPDEELKERILSDVRRKLTSSDWNESNGQFVPYPATYLNGRRWEDEEPKKQHGYQEHTYTDDAFDRVFVNLDD